MEQTKNEPKNENKAAPGNDKPKNERKPLTEFLKPQGRFKHLFKPGNEALLEEIQQDVDDFWAYLEGRVEGSKDL